MNHDIPKIEYWFVMLIPLINVIVPFLMIDYDPGGLHAGTVRGFLIIMFCGYFVFKRLEFWPVNMFIMLFLLYFIIIIVDSNFSYKALYSFSHVVITSLMFSVGYFYIRKFEDLVILNRIFVICLVIICMYLLYANIFKFGTSDYLEDSLYFGDVNVAITKTMAALLVTAPVILLLEKSRKGYLILLFLISLLFILMGLKRSALLSIVCALVIYILLAPEKLRIVKAGVILVVLLILFSPLYLDTLFDRYTAREEAVDSMLRPGESIEERRDRMGEFLRVIDIVNDEGSWAMLFGIRAFDIVGVVPLGGRRPLHVDYSVFLYSGGYIGLMFFLLLYVFIHFEKERYYKNVKHYFWAREMNAVFYALIGLALIMSIAGSWASIGLRSIIFIYLGGITAVMKNYVYNETSS